MPKTKFSKSELARLNKLLIQERMFPIAKIGIYNDAFNSSYHNEYNVIRFLSESRKQLDIGFITLTVPKVELLKKQLENFFL